ncbi:MAG TPA: hypothetical protein V6D27_07575 [Vampirovibrionales bacterium]
MNTEFLIIPAQFPKQLADSPDPVESVKNPGKNPNRHSQFEGDRQQ